MTRRDHRRLCFGSATPQVRALTPDARVRIRRRSMHSSHPSQTASRSTLPSHRGPIARHQSKCRVRHLPCQPTGSTFAKLYCGAITTNAWSAELLAGLLKRTCITFSRVQPEDRTSRRTWSLCATMLAFWPSRWPMIPNVLAFACGINCSEQGCLLQRLRKNRNDTSKFGALAHPIGVRRDDDGRNLQAVAHQIVVKLQAGHFWHLQIDNQAFGESSRQRVDKLFRGPKRLGLKPTMKQCRSQGLQHRQVVIDNSDPGGSLRHRANVERGCGFATCTLGQCRGPQNPSTLRFQPFPLSAQGRLLS